MWLLSLAKSRAVVLPLLLLSPFKFQQLIAATSSITSGPGSGQREVAQLKKQGFKCFVSGDCITCSQEELAQPFCQRTRRRQEMTCEKEGEELADPATVDAKEESREGKRVTVTTFDSCTTTSADDLTAVIRFQALMAIIGGLALYGVRHQKMRHMSLYDKRRSSDAPPPRGRIHGGL